MLKVFLQRAGRIPGADAKTLVCIQCGRAKGAPRTTMNTPHVSSQRHLRILRDIICSLCILLWAAPFAPAQEVQEPPTPGTTLKVTSEVVNVYAVVRKKNGRLIADLNKDDFTLEEDRQPQVIRYFAREADT